MDFDNLRIALRKARICALHDDPRIVCSIRGSRKSKGVKHGFGQTMDSSWKILYTVIGSMVLLPRAWRCYYVHSRMEKKLLMLFSDTSGQLKAVTICPSGILKFCARIITCNQKKHLLNKIKIIIIVCILTSLKRTSSPKRNSCISDTPSTFAAATNYTS